MSGPTYLSALAPLVEMLVEADQAADRDRVLLDAPLYLGIAPAAALWRPVAERLGAAPEWREILSRGPRDALPTQAQILAVVSGHLSGELPDGRRVLIAGQGRTLCALALGGVLSSEEGTDLIEALLVASTAIEEASTEQRSASLLDQIAAPLPASAPTRELPDEYDRLCHDVRNHLASIRTTQELLDRYESRLNDNERDHFQEVLEREVRRASGLLVRAVHPEADEAAGHPRRRGCERPHEVVDDVVSAERAACHAAGVGLELTLEPGAESLTCALDELELARIVRNLVVNARQALRGRESNPHVHVVLAPDPRTSANWMRLSVRDNGPGIPEGDLKRVFKAGFTSGKAEGHGVGLSVVHDLVASVGGTAVAHNLAPTGADFEIQLPPGNET